MLTNFPPQSLHVHLWPEVRKAICDTTFLTAHSTAFGLMADSPSLEAATVFSNFVLGFMAQKSKSESSGCLGSGFFAALGLELRCCNLRISSSW